MSYLSNLLMARHQLVRFCGEIRLIWGALACNKSEARLSPRLFESHVRPNLELQKETQTWVFASIFSWVYCATIRQMQLR